MANLFSIIEEEIIFNEEICFDENKIKEFILENIKKKIENSSNKGFTFEEIVYDFFEYMNIPFNQNQKNKRWRFRWFCKF